MAVSGYGYALTGLLGRGRGRGSASPLISVGPNAVTPVIVDDLLFSPDAISGYTLTAQGGSYSLTGGSATLLRTKRLTANGGSYTVTGGTAALLRSKQLVASGGSYTVTGGAALLSRNRTLTAQGGVYTYTGQQVNITYVPVSVGYTLTAQGGSYTLTGAGVTIQRSKQLYASGGSYNLTGGSANISRNRKLTASGGAYTYVGSSAVLMHVTPYPDPGYVLLGITYGPGGIYVGTLDALDKSVKFDITTGALVKPINNKVVMSL